MRFRIHFYIGASYCCELYNESGQSIYGFNEAIREAYRQFPNDEWQVYDGHDAYEYNRRDMKKGIVKQYRLGIFDSKCDHCDYKGRGFVYYDELETEKNSDPVQNLAECPKCGFGT